MGSPVLEKNGFIVKCSKCNSESVDFAYNDGAVLFICLNCGHQGDKEDEYEILEVIFERSRKAKLLLAPKKKENKNDEKN